jgi:hypothetical protein
MPVIFGLFSAAEALKERRKKEVRIVMTLTFNLLLPYTDLMKGSATTVKWIHTLSKKKIRSSECVPNP